MKKRIRILLADDHPVVRKGIRSCLSRHEHLEIVGESSDGRETLAHAKELVPDLVLMDIDMPIMNGLAVTEVLRKDLPETKVIILSMHGDPDHVKRILQSGARGLVLKDAATEELVKAIETVHGGESWFSAEVARVALSQVMNGGEAGTNVSVLSGREQEVLVFVAEGLSNKEIAVQLGVGVRTVETHRERIMNKLNIHNVAGLTKFAIAKGLVTLRTDGSR